jgi:hypothetical protein
MAFVRQPDGFDPPTRTPVLKGASLKRLSLALAAFVSTPCFAGAGAATLDGTWRVNGEVQGNPVNPICVLAEKDAKITGTCLGTDGKPVPVTGTVTDKGYKWQYDTAYQGSGITIYFTGSFDKDGNLAGGVYVEPYAVDGSFTAKREKAAAAAPPAS